MQISVVVALMDGALIKGTNYIFQYRSKQMNFQNTIGSGFTLLFAHSLDFRDTRGKLILKVSGS